MDAVLSGLNTFLDPSTLFFLAAGVFAGLVVGVIPGLGGTAAVAVLLPFIFVLDAPQAMALIIGAVAVVHHSDAIASILLGIPGSSSAAVLLLDGHVMAKQGKGAKALSLAFMSSMAGGLIGAIGLTLAIPVARPLVLLFGSPEIFMLTVLGISLTALLSKGNLVKGLVAGAFGVLLGQVGAAPAAPDYRFIFGNLDLADGLDLVAVALSIFGIAEIIHLVAKKTAVANVTSLGTGWMEGVKEFFPNFMHVLRGALIGIWAGVLPGVGATAGTWMAYGQAQATARGKKKGKFGKGDPRGVIAPESAANSVEAGDLIPTLLFGIPGGAPAALLLGALLIFGIEPGPRIITDHLDLIYVIIWSFGIASVVGSLLCFVIAKPLSMLSFVRFPLLAAGLIPILFMAGFQGSLLIQMIPLMLILGVVGWFMKEFDYPRAPFLIGFVLSIPMERYYYLTDKLYSFSEWATRPGVLVMAVILIIPIVMALVRLIRKRLGHTTEKVSTESDLAVDNAPRSWAVVIAGIFFIIFAGAFVLAQQFAEAARLMPNVITVIGATLSLVAMIIELRKLKSDAPRTDETRAAWKKVLTVTFASTMWLLGFVVLIYVFGMAVACLVYVPLFLWFVAKAKWWVIPIYTVALLALLLVAQQFAGISLPDGYVYLGI
ncbi:tripartite tricarboxylate transporter permease [Paramicrobacterium chengjingii]|uniref:Tripartite tricarboxylate transporter permease n=1 Tax=Paramicrobacterium chengjingii TaxID=2769067 RepID=A0ABX6YI84_9MICO|nr:tripartite tricarboxylate transporter permease [Microbacterium chengjingii]QPZ38420.1 tripartite tricarboxylate transporter permease [Microbacterium chengjingii]